jgi:hypothetical protein
MNVQSSYSDPLPGIEEQQPERFVSLALHWRLWEFGGSLSLGDDGWWGAGLLLGPLTLAVSLPHA